MPYSIILCITIYNIYILPLNSNHKIASVKIGKLEHTKTRSQVEAKTHIRTWDTKTCCTWTHNHQGPRDTTLRGTNNLGSYTKQQEQGEEGKEDWRQRTNCSKSLSKEVANHHILTTCCFDPGPSKHQLINITVSSTSKIKGPYAATATTLPTSSKQLQPQGPVLALEGVCLQLFFKHPHPHFMLTLL